MRLRSLAAVLTFSSLMLAAAAPAHADDAKDKSRAEFRRGVALVHQNDYAGARVAFAEAYKLYPHPSILLNLGISEWKNGEYVEAESTLTKYLSDYGDASADDIESARSALREVHTHVGVIRLTVQTSGARAFVDDQPRAIVVGEPVEVRAATGDHVLRVEADGDAPFRKNIHLNGKDPEVDEVTLVPWNGSSPPPVSTNSSAPTTPTDTTSSADDATSSRHLTGWILVGVGVVAAGVGTVTGLKALSLSSTYNDHQDSGTQRDADKSNGVTFRTVADISFLAAIGCGGVGAYFLLTKPESSSSSSPASSQAPSASLGVIPGGLSLRGSF